MQRNNYSAGSKFFSSEEFFFYQPVGFFWEEAGRNLKRTGSEISETQIAVLSSLRHDCSPRMTGVLCKEGRLAKSGRSELQTEIGLTEISDPVLFVSRQ